MKPCLQSKMRPTCLNIYYSLYIIYYAFTNTFISFSRIINSNAIKIGTTISSTRIFFDRRWSLAEVRTTTRSDLTSEAANRNFKLQPIRTRRRPTCIRTRRTGKTARWIRTLQWTLCPCRPSTLPCQPRRFDINTNLHKS